MILRQRLGLDAQVDNIRICNDAVFLSSCCEANMYYSAVAMQRKARAPIKPAPPGLHAPASSRSALHPLDSRARAAAAAAAAESTRQGAARRPRWRAAAHRGGNSAGTESNPVKKEMKRNEKIDG
jgi:hypothetical protein